MERHLTAEEVAESFEIAKAADRIISLKKKEEPKPSLWRRIKCFLRWHSIYSLKDDEWENAGWGWNRCVYCGRSFPW